MAGMSRGNGFKKKTTVLGVFFGSQKEFGLGKGERWGVPREAPSPILIRVISQSISFLGSFGV
jgi:hypothetical protein